MPNVLITADVPGWDQSYWGIGKVVAVNEQTANALVLADLGEITSAPPTNTIPTSADLLAAVFSNLPSDLPDIPDQLWNNGGVPSLS